MTGLTATPQGRDGRHPIGEMQSGRPDRIGRFRMIVRLKIDPAAAKDHQIFRIAD